MSENARKVGLNNILCRKKCGKLDFIIFIGEKSSESWTLSFLLAEKNTFLCKKLILSFLKVLFLNLINIQLNEEYQLILTN